MTVNPSLPSLEDRLNNCRAPKNHFNLVAQTWSDLLFLHWEYDPKALQDTLPKGLYIDTFKNKGYVGIVLFLIQNSRIGFFPPLPFLSNFIELNIRTYVYDEQKRPGVWFYSLNINSYIFSELSKLFFGLPYHNLPLQTSNRNGKIEFDCSSDSNIQFGYKKLDYIGLAQPDSLNFFLLERYGYFIELQGKLRMKRIKHEPYVLYNAEVSKCTNLLLETVSLKSSKNVPDHVLYSPKVEANILGGYC